MQYCNDNSLFKTIIMENGKRPPKPKTPKRVFTDGVWEYTIVKYEYIKPGDKLFKPGWQPTLKIFNPDHPNLKKLVASVQKAQLEIKNRSKRGSWEHMNRPMDF